MKSNTVIFAIIGVVVLGGLLYWAGSSSRPETTVGDVVSQNGIHWHPTLTIYVDGEKQDIPANVGLIGGHSPMHTHGEDVADGVLHFEFDGVVRTGDLQLGNFFHIWDGREVETAFGTLERMTVNGEENTEYGSYVVGEHDAVELFYRETDVDDNTTSAVVE